jgi:ribonuclease Z
MRKGAGPWTAAGNSRTVAKVANSSRKDEESDQEEVEILVEEIEVVSSAPQQGRGTAAAGSSGTQYHKPPYPHHHQRSSSPSSSTHHPQYSTPGGFYIAGAWTKAGIGSCIHVKGNKNRESILFDCGVVDEQTYAASHVFISHGHVDHIGALILHARARSLGTNTCKYYIPATAMEPLAQAVAAFSVLDGKEIQADIIPVVPGDSIVVNPNCTVKVFPTLHRVPSQGYALYSTKKGSLLPQYRNRPHQEIKALKQQGVEIMAPAEEALELVYTGDTIFEGLKQSSFVFDAPMLITELTYLDKDTSAAVKYGHIHISDIVDNWQLFNNQYVVFCHISPRYNPASRIIAILRSELPEELQDKVLVNLRSFGEKANVTKILRDVSLTDNNRQIGWGWAQQLPRNAHSVSSHHSGHRFHRNVISDGGDRRHNQGGRGHSTDTKHISRDFSQARIAGDSTNNSTTVSTVADLQHIHFGNSERGSMLYRRSYSDEPVRNFSQPPAASRSESKSRETDKAPYKKPKNKHLPSEES